MTDTNLVSSTDLTNEGQPTAPAGEAVLPHTGLAATVIAWSWDIRQDKFSMDFSAINSMLGLTKPIDNIEGFLALLSKQDRRKIVRLFKATMADKPMSPVKVCLAPQDSTTSYCLVKASKGESEFLEGELRPLVTMPSNGEFANIFQQIFDNDHHGMILTDDRSHIIVCNGYVERWSGYTLEELIGQHTRTLNAGKHGKAYYQDMWQRIEQNGFWSGLILSRRKDGKAIPQELTIQKIVSTTNHVYYLGISQDLSKSLYRIAGKEHGGIELLTQLPNEADFKQRLSSFHQKMKEDEGLLLLAFSPKLDEGDELDYKRELASSLTYFTDDALSGYLGGNTFTVAMRYQRSSDKPHSLSIYSAIKKLFSYLKQELEPFIYKIVIESTVGASVLSLDADSSTQLIPHALQAMFEKHNENGNNVCFYSSKLHAKVERREKMEAIVTRAVEDERVEVFFQPIIDTRDWEFSKFEALCRFRDENGALLNTQEMVLIAEDLNLVSQLDLIIAEKAIQSRELLTVLFTDDIRIAINVSLNAAKSLNTIFSDINTLLERYPEHAAYLTIELTESAYFDREEIDAQALMNIRSKGVAIAIDDFGSGYSSFSYLKDGHFDFLKIDIEFITGITYGSHNYHIVKMIVKLAHTLGVKVIAEGVETLQEIALLKDLQVDLLQGYYFAKPVPAEKIQPASSYINKLKQLKSLKADEEEVELIRDPPLLTPSHTIADIKELFDSTNYEALPVINDDACVGLIDRYTYNLHLSPTLGTDIETMNDVRILKKRAQQIMRTDIFRVSSEISYQEIFSNVEQEAPFPWVALDEEGDYVGVIECKDILKILARF